MTPRFDHPFELARELARSHIRIGVEPDHNPGLKYTIVVPRGWGRANGLAGALPKSRAEILGVFSPGPDLAGPRVVVTCTPLRWEVDPLGWTQYGLERAGWRIVVGRWLKTPRGRFEIGALRAGQDGGIEVRRCTGWVDNGRLLRVDVIVPNEQWQALHDTVWPCGPLMQLANATRRSAIEKHNTYEGPTWKLALPDSWGVRSIETGRPGQHCWIAIPRDAVQSAVALRADVWERQAPTPADRIASLRHNLHGEGTAMARRGQPLDLYDADELEGLVAAVRFEATHRERGPVEVWVCQLHQHPVSVDLTMVVHAPKEHAIDRFRAARALDVAAHTVRMQQEGRNHVG